MFPPRRLNALAVFHLLPHIKDRDILDQTLDDFLKATIPEVRLALENGGKPPVTNDTPSLASIFLIPIIPKYFQSNRKM